MKVNLTLDDLQVLAAHSKKIGTQDQMIDVLLEWASNAQCYLLGMKQGQARGNTISENVFNDLLVHGFDNDPEVEKILRQYLRIY